jgi:phosphate transport system substrate-binding protein
MKFVPLLLAAALTLTNAMAQGPLRIEGSNTFGEKLGPLLVTAFEGKNPGIRVALKRPGSGPGLLALIAGRTDIAPTSRPANRAELQAAKKAGVRLVPQAIGSYGVAVVVNAQNPVKNLKPSQVRAIFSGKITDWNQLRGPDQPINLVILGPQTGARAGFQNLAMRGDDYAATATALPDYATMVAAVAADPFAIGYADIRSLPAGTRSVLINGEPANAMAIYEQVYPYASPLYLYTLEHGTSAAAKKFVRFVQSREGQRIMAKAGFVPRLPAAPFAERSLAP